jgi:hypothetical protein
MSIAWMVALGIGTFAAGRFSFVWSQRAGAVERIPILHPFGEPMSHCRAVEPAFDQDEQ